MRLALFLALAGIAFALYSVARELRLNTDEGGVACTLEAKICPDGSAVGRVGPSCEFAACPGEGSGSGGGGILPYHGGVRGIVLLGPVCPAERVPPEEGCGPRPYQTTIVVAHASTPTKIFATTEGAQDGTFEISLPPGDYLLTARGGEPFPSCGFTGATVAPGGYVEATIECDTGIR